MRKEKLLYIVRVAQLRLADLADAYHGVGRWAWFRRGNRPSPAEYGVCREAAIATEKFRMLEEELVRSA